MSDFQITVAASFLSRISVPLAVFTVIFVFLVAVTAVLVAKELVKKDGNHHAGI